MKKLICLVFLLIALSFSCGAVDISAKSAILYDCYTNSVLFEKNADEQRPIASTTKIMTGLIASELYDPNCQVTVKAEWCGAEGSSMYLTPGEKLKIKDLLYGLMLMSGNDAAYTLASLYSGNVDDFVALMNTKSNEIKLENTHFANPSGLDDPQNHSTAKDLALLTKYALANTTFAQICSTKQITCADRFMTNHNKLLFSLRGAVGVKTGYTDEAGRCLVSAVSRNGRTMIAVTLDASDDWNDHEKLYDMGFYDVRTRTVVKKGLIGYANIAGKGSVELHINNDIIAYVTSKELDEIEVSLKGRRIEYGGFNKGEEYGFLSVSINGNLICTEPVYFAESVLQDTPKLTLWDKIKNIFKI